VQPFDVIRFEQKRIIVRKLLLTGNASRPSSWGMSLIILCMADDNIFGDWLTDQLTQRNLSQAEFAQKAGVHKSVICKLCARQVMKPQLSTFAAIAKALDVPLTTVLQKAGLIQPDPELPLLNEFKHVIQQLTPYGQEMGLEVLRGMVKAERRYKGADRG
jgi:transcriptional regulator with XRE-family HTH domain